MNNQEQKQEKADKILQKLSHLENYGKISFTELDKDSIYFHLKITLDDDTYITAQSDTQCKHDFLFYALKFHSKSPNNEHFTIEVYDDLLDNVVVGYSTNKENLMLALSTLGKVRNHIRKLESYTTDYVSQTILGNSLDRLTNDFISELKTTNQLLKFMQTKVKYNE